MTTRLHKKNEMPEHQGPEAATSAAGERRVISASGQVIKIEEDFVWAQIEGNSACAHCTARPGCGVVELTKLFGRRANHIRIPNSMKASLGDEVILGVSETALLKATVMLYLLPLLSMLISAGVINVMVSNEVSIVLAAGFGLFAGLGAVRYLALRNATDNTLQPFMLSSKQADEKFRKA